LRDAILPLPDTETCPCQIPCEIINQRVDILLNFNLTRKLSNVFKDLRSCPNTSKNGKFVNRRKQGGYQTFISPLLPIQLSCQKMRGRSDSWGENLPSFRPGHGQVSLAGLVAASCIHHRFGNAGAAMIR